MASLDIRKHSSLEALVSAYVKDNSPRGGGRSAGAALLFGEPFFAGAALVAHWIREFAPELLERPLLHIAVFSALPDRVELAAGSSTYEFLPQMLGKPELPINITSVIRNASENERAALMGDSFKASGLPLHAYLENVPDGPIDLLVLHDVDVGFADVRDWAEPLGRAIAAGLKVAAVAMNEDEQLLIEGLLSLHGFTVTGKPVLNQFAPRIPWGEVMWQVGAGFVHGESPEGTLVEEVGQLTMFIRQYSKHHHSFPPLRHYGVRVTGKNSPAKDGRPLLQLPEGLLFDPATEQFSGLLPDGLVSIHELDDLGRNSALLASYDGRTGRFQQIMWAVRVFFECARLLPGLLQSLAEGEEDDDPEVCPGCGGTHTATERVDSMKEYLSEVFEGESPRTQVRAALELALDIVKRGGAVSDSHLDDDDDHEDEHSDLELYESLLRRGHYRAAWGLVQDCEHEDLLDEGLDEDGWTLPMLLVENGLWDILDEMLIAGEDVVIHSAEDGENLFHALAWAVEPIPPELFERLRKAMAEFDIDANTPDEMQTFPLEAAVMTENWAAVAQLIDAGADLSLTDMNAHKVAKALTTNGFDKQAKKLVPKEQKKRTRQPAQPRSTN